MITDELITSAYNLSGKVSRDFETVAGSDLADGLTLLNDILSEKSMTARYIPYYGHLSLNTVIGQESYDVSGLILVDAVTFNIGDVRYSMTRRNRRYYFGSPRVDNITSLPGQYYVERMVGGTRIYLYFLPADIYDLKITGKSSLMELQADTDLSSLDRFYISYLKYLLAKRICQFNSITFAPDKEATLKEIEDQLDNVSETDMTVQKSSTLSRGTAYNWGQTNIGKGWTAPT